MSKCCKYSESIHLLNFFTLFFHHNGFFFSYKMIKPSKKKCGENSLFMTLILKFAAQNNNSNVYELDRDLAV